MKNFIALLMFHTINSFDHDNKLVGQLEQIFYFLFWEGRYIKFHFAGEETKTREVTWLGERYYKPCPLALFIHSTNTHYASAIFLLTLPLNGDKTMKKIENVSKPMSLNSLQ